MRLRSRLLLLNLVVVGVTAAVLALSVYFVVARQMSQEAWDFLHDEFGEYSLKYRTLLDRPEMLRAEMLDHFTRARMAYPIFCRVYDEQGQTLADVENVPDVPDPAPARVRAALRGQPARYDLGSQNSRSTYWCEISRIDAPSGKPFAFELGLDTLQLTGRIHQLRNYLLAMVPMALLMSLAGAWILTQYSLRPFGQLLESLRRIRGASLNQRLPVQVSRDELGQLAAAVNDMLDDIEHAFSLAKEFTADAAHELRTPLARLSIMLEDALRRPLSEEASRAALDEAYEQCVRLRRLVDDLMLLARLDSGEPDGEPTACDLAAVIEDMRELWATACEERSLAFESQAGAPLKVLGRPVLLRRVLVNLMDNALRCTPRGGAVRIWTDGSPTEVMVAVTDTGPGILPEQQARLFNRFFRTDPSRNAQTGGTGLGLSICRKIVELHRGRIEVESRAGAGATFRVYLPRRRENG